MISKKTSTAKVVIEFMEGQVITPLMAHGKMVSDNAFCISARALQDYMECSGTILTKVLAYAPMSDGRAEKMVGTINYRVGNLVES